ncbi:uncharacterized protein P174DRAFT_67872 [Aspergillus novofumigatus IBT 16806]|uniref:Uncharacterized protein n=1 Tax=Aspergillus novofumigatus (strain IBT 16806) TaxID=1392255 RepID=A0A2I1BTV3_ASPN1|nr:uncharacterized protein P174DRAFT_67872 [Aspergillus novofumigatus IBT 16806]PKX88833.1 hypothetical protein P174DRAFT_67872 [Aspergillus novofumigatus IBT 16806]
MKFSTVLLASSALLSGVSAGVIWTDSELNEICWKVCFHEKPHCPHGWHEKHFGHCWTCCKDHHSDAKDDLYRWL